MNFIPRPARKQRNRFGKIFTEKEMEDVLRRTQGRSF